MKKEKSIKNLEAKELGNFTKTFGKKVFGGEGAPTRSIKEIVITVHHLQEDDDAPIDQTNDGPY
ncbi:hypothetical protein MP477_03275 [Chryseobacterium sp. WG23]|uniref:hypothetical protein n=1 Tax=Chryseobacterium sp. WG23 TaxID=2926910 RepID=UPI00211EC5A8|nr:hypothetical protein [Chryseobacterium sp. WG23]MCQ9633972.1 hypothetical protein [Chryseobacterium sp. WG23]